MLEDLDIAYQQALHVSVLDVIPLPSELNHQVDYDLSTPIGQHRLERRVQFEECIKAACQAKFKAHRHFGLKMYWRNMTDQYDMFPTVTHIDRSWRRSYMTTQLYDFMDGNSPCIVDISPISFKDACRACGYFCS